MIKFSDKLWKKLQGEDFFAKPMVNKDLAEIFEDQMRAVKLIRYHIKGFNFPLQDIRNVFKQSAEDDAILIDYYKICRTFTDGHLDMDKTAINVAKNVNRRLTYTSDKSNWGQTEYWATPIEIHQKKRDDCDGYAVLTCYVCGLLGIPAYRRFVRAGNVTTDSGKEYGHATFLYLSTRNNCFYPLEGSFYSQRSFNKFDIVPLIHRTEYHNTWWITNEIKSFGTSWLFQIS